MTKTPGLQFSVPVAICGFIVCLLVTPETTITNVLGVPLHLMVWIGVALVILAALLIDALRFIANVGEEDK